MAWTIVGTSSVQSSTEVATISVPGGTTDGDLCVVWLVNDAQSGIPTFAGWTAFGAQAGSATTNHFGRGFYRVASGEGASWVFDTGLSVAADVGAVAIVLRGFDPGDIVEAYGTPINQTSATTVLVAPNIVPATDGCMLLGVWFTAADTTTITPGGGFSTQVTLNNAASGRTVIATLEQATAASITPSATGGASDTYIAWAAAINPAPAPSGTARAQIITVVG